jgi:DNA-binding CsgD family transcriptional regulator
MSGALAAPLHEAIRNSSLAIALVQLRTRRFVEVSRRAATFFGGEPRALRGTDALAVSDEPETSGRAWDVIADGLLDGYQARRKLRGSHGTVDSHIWTRVLRRNGTDADAVVIVTPVRGELDWPLDDTDDDREAVVVAHRVGPDREALPHQGSLEYLVVPVLEIVHPDDIATILTTIEEALSHRAQVSVVVRVRDEAGSWQRSQLSLGPVDDETQSFGFALTGAGEATALVPPRERVIELEQRLQRIAREVEAAGVVSGFGRPPDAETLPGLENLTSRQWEVVTRLARGERVSEMARGMYLSPSTVRNHLANLFRKVGVHSQSEFLDLLRRHDRTQAAQSARAYVPNA